MKDRINSENYDSLQEKCMDLGRIPFWLSIQAAHKFDADINERINWKAENTRDPKNLFYIPKLVQ